MSSPVGSAVAASSTTTSRPPKSRVEPAERAEANSRISEIGKLPLEQDAAHHAADLAGGADDADPHAVAARAEAAQRGPRRGA